MRSFLESDYKEYSRWIRQRLSIPPPYSLLPKTGLIEPGVAAGFLISTDCGLAILDFFAANRYCDKLHRSEVLERIGQMLISTARQAGFRFIKYDTMYLTIADMAKRNGFRELGSFQCFIKEL